jgi:hypothetical protein
LGPADSLRELLREPEKIFGLKKLYAGVPCLTDEKTDEAFARTLVIDDLKYLPGFAVNDTSDPNAILNYWLQVKEEFHNRISRTTFEAMPYIFSAAWADYCRNFFMTKSGYIGLGPIPLRAGDGVVAFAGAEAPFILRELNPENTQGSAEPGDGSQHILRKEWELIGDCYLHGFMNNEILAKGYKEEKIWIR